MQINIRNGTIALGSVYKLIFAGWVISWGVMFSFILLIILLSSLVSGIAHINGEQVEGAGNILVGMLPFLLIFPVIITLQGAIFAGLLTVGVWLFRKFRPITVVNHDPATSF